MIILEKPDRKGRVGHRKGSEITGRIDFIVPQGRGCPTAWTINEGQTVAIALTGEQEFNKPELLVVSIGRSTALHLMAELEKALAVEVTA